VATAASHGTSYRRAAASLAWVLLPRRVVLDRNHRSAIGTSRKGKRI
jgi:hypothetical protein